MPHDEPIPDGLSAPSGQEQLEIPEIPPAPAPSAPTSYGISGLVGDALEIEVPSVPGKIHARSFLGWRLKTFRPDSAALPTATVLLRPPPKRHTAGLRPWSEKWFHRALAMMLWGIFMSYFCTR